MARRRTLITLPEKALNDQTLTLRDLRVLGALELFCDRNTGISSPGRDEISGLTGIGEEHVSKITTKLAKAGWVEKSGKGCRSNPTQYTLLWLLKEVEEDALKGAASGTQSSLERVPPVAPNQDTKGATSGTQSSPKGAASGTQSSLKGAVSGTQYAYQRVHAHEYSYLLNIYNYPDPDPDQTRRAEVVDSGFGLTDAFDILIAHGTPEHYLRKVEDRQLVASWLEAGVDAAWLTQACAESVKRKRDSRPIGPRYVDKVMTSMAEEVKRAAGDSFAGADYRQGL